MHRTVARLALGALLLVAGCRTPSSGRDPTSGAIHMPVVGQTESFSRQQDDVRTEDGSPVRSYVDEVRYVHDLVADAWIHRELHRDADGVDLERVFAELERAVASREIERLQYTRALRRALCRLSDGNLGLVDGPGFSRHDSGLVVRGDVRELAIAKIDEARYRSARKVVVGSRVATIERRPLEAWSHERCVATGSTPQQRRERLAEALGVQVRLADEVISPAQIGVRTPEGGEAPVQLQWRPVPIPVTRTCVVAETVSGMTENKIGTLTVHDLECSDAPNDSAALRGQLDHAIEALAGHAHVIVDLRHAFGRSREGARVLASRFGTEGSEWARYRERSPDARAETTSTTETLPEPEGRRIDAKVWVLVGPGCAAACELVAAYASTQDDVVLLGQTTAGAGGETQTHTLPFSDVRIAVPNRTFMIPGTDTAIEGRGVSPGIEVLPGIDDLRAGRDAVLEATLERIAQTP